MNSYKRILIANRGEIAVRIARTCQRLGIETVAIYSDADANCLHRRLCTYAVHLPGVASADTYLNIDRILEAAKLAEVDAIHPGYGFLSESSAFAESVEKLQIKLIGPSAKSMSLMGDKVTAKKLMQDHQVPVVPGSDGALDSVEELQSCIQRIGYPVILKAASGGGGRGMRIVSREDEIESAYESCVREAGAYFGNPVVFCEKYVDSPKHIEFQILVDQHRNGVHLFERDCSIQRRHQKLFEEAPSMFLSEEVRNNLGDIAVKAAIAAGYEGAGTVEFICDGDQNAYFMEMNTRIQVEHPVTEMITGVDLIEQQIKVAQGEPLEFSQKDLRINGWAVEARINSEDPKKDFLPGPGLVDHVLLPQGPFVRVDSHLYTGYKIPESYDSMVAKVIAWGANRKEAIERLLVALSEFEISGVPTTISFHEALCKNQDFLEGKFTTKFLEKEMENLKENMTSKGSLGEELLPVFAYLATKEVVGCQGQPSRGHDQSRNQWQELGKQTAVHRMR